MIRGLLLFTVLFIRVYSQNLIVNGDFEDFFECPNNLGQIAKCKNLINPNIFTSPDYFNYTCFENKIDYKPYILFETTPHSGNSYIGLASRSELAYSYQEYVLLELDSMLISGRKYTLSFFVKLNNLKYYQNVFDIVFTDKKEFNKKMVKGYSIIDEPNVINIFKRGGYRDSVNWEKVSIQYTAKGHEKYILVGLNYKTLIKFHYSNKKKYLLNTNCQDDICYYFMDSFSLLEAKE